MKRLARKTHHLKDFFRNDIWELNLEELSKAKARFIKYLKVAAITIKTFSSEKIGFQAVALSFFSTMSVVPFVAITFAITDGFGIGESLKELMYQCLQHRKCFHIKSQIAEGMRIHHGAAEKHEDDEW